MVDLLGFFVKLLRSGILLFLCLIIYLYLSGGFLDQEVRVLYLEGERVCETGYDFKRPRCRYVSPREWDSVRHRMYWAVLEQDTGRYLRTEELFIEV